jgi:hypothetical protein
LATHDWGKGHALDHKTALHFVITWLEANVAGMKVVAAGHRVVLGGTRFGAPVRIDAEIERRRSPDPVRPHGRRRHFLSASSSTLLCWPKRAKAWRSVLA